MQEIEVYLDHNAQLELVGKLTYEQLRGNATYHFSYDAAWLTHHPHLLTTCCQTKLRRKSSMR